MLRMCLAGLSLQYISYARRISLPLYVLSFVLGEYTSGFFRGVFPALVGICPSILSHSLVYYMLKKVLTKGTWSGERHGTRTELLCGSAAILAQNIVTNPIAVIQTRMQVHLALLTESCNAPHRVRLG